MGNITVIQTNENELKNLNNSKENENWTWTKNTSVIETQTLINSNTTSRTLSKSSSKPPIFHRLKKKSLSILYQLLYKQFSVFGEIKNKKLIQSIKQVEFNLVIA